MIQAEALSRGGVDDRRLTLVAVADPQELLSGSLSIDSHFSCFLAWDATGATSSEIVAVAEMLLDAGAVSVSCWGADCERVHHEFDDLVSGIGSGASRTPQSVMTTWHSRESFEQALWYALVVAQPTDQFEHSCGDSIFILIDQPAQGDLTRAALLDPDQFAKSIES